MTANGVVYVNGSSQPTSNSALTFDGSNFKVGSGGSGNSLGMLVSRGATTNFYEAYDGTKTFIGGVDSANAFAKVGTLSAHDVSIITANGSKIYIANSTGNVGIGISSPVYKLDVQAGSVSATGDATALRLYQAGDGGVAMLFTNGVADLVRLAGTVTSTGAGTDDGVFTIQTATNGTLAERARIDSSGNLLVNQTTQNGSGKTEISFDRATNWGMQIRNTTGTTSAATFIQFKYVNTGCGLIQSTDGSTTSYTTTSDYRLKENVLPMSGALAKVQALKPVTYTWKNTGKTAEGFIAHELAEICPQAVVGEKDATSIEQYEISPAVAATYDEDGNELTAAVEAVMGEREVPQYQGIDVSFLVATLTAAIQELKAEVDSLKAQIQGA